MMIRHLVKNVKKMFLFQPPTYRLLTGMRSAPITVNVSYSDMNAIIKYTARKTVTNGLCFSKSYDVTFYHTVTFEQNESCSENETISGYFESEYTQPDGSKDKIYYRITQGHAECDCIITDIHYVSAEFDTVSVHNASPYVIPYNTRIATIPFEFIVNQEDNCGNTYRVLTYSSTTVNLGSDNMTCEQKTITGETTVTYNKNQFRLKYSVIQDVREECHDCRPSVTYNVTSYTCSACSEATAVPGTGGNFTVTFHYDKTVVDNECNRTTSQGSASVNGTLPTNEVCDKKYNVIDSSTTVTLGGEVFTHTFSIYQQRNREVCPKCPTSITYCTEDHLNTPIVRSNWSEGYVDGKADIMGAKLTGLTVQYTSVTITEDCDEVITTGVSSFTQTVPVYGTVEPDDEWYQYGPVQGQGQNKYKTLTIRHKYGNATPGKGSCNIVTFTVDQWICFNRPAEIRNDIDKDFFRCTGGTVTFRANWTGYFPEETTGD